MRKTKKAAKMLIPEVVDGGTHADFVGTIGLLLERVRSNWNVRELAYAIEAQESGIAREASRFGAHL